MEQDIPEAHNKWSIQNISHDSQLHINVFQRALVSQNPALLPSLTVYFSENSAKIRTHVSQFDLMYHVYQEQSLGIDQECKGESNNHKINIDQLWLSP